MSGNNMDYVGNDIYSKHLRGDSARFSGSQANSRTAILQRMYVRTLTELCANRFEWKNLPDTIDPRFLELSLFYRALVVFFKQDEDDENSYFVTRGASQGVWDVADNPTRFQLFGNQFNGQFKSAIRTYHTETNPEDGSQILIANDPECVPIWANFLRTPDIDLVMIYASKLADLDMTIEINMHNARRNKIVAVDQNQKLSAVNINQQIDQGENFIQLMPNAVGALPVALDLGINPDTIEKLHILKVRLYNELMGYLGINNANQDKKERLVADEVDANNEQVSANRAVALNARQDAAKLINDRWGLNIEVVMRSDEQTSKLAAQENGGEAEAETTDNVTKLEAV